MGWVDDILIAKVASPFTGWLQHQLGIGQWRAAMECLNGSIACYLAAVAFDIAAKGPEGGIFITMLRALAWLLIMDRVRLLARRQSGSSLGTQTARMREWAFRTVLALMVPVSLCYVGSWSDIFYTASLLMLTCHLYLKASDAPPPEPRGRLAFHSA
jgi:hypothetical protein